MTVDDPTLLLRAREAELSAIYDYVPGIVFYIIVEADGEFRFLSVSRDFLVATGLTREQVIGSRVRDVIPAPSCDTVLKHYREAIRSGRPVRWEEESAYPAGRRYGEVAVKPICDARGVATHLIGIVHDVTERKRLENVRAEEEQRKDEFLSLLGHELRNPLAAISTAVQLLSGGVTDEQRTSLNEMMDRQVKLMQRLLDDLLDLARITHGYIQLKKERIDLAKFLQHVIEVTQPTVAERGQKMILQLPSEIVTFMADEARLEQIALNLLSNASKYTAQGGRIEFSGAREGSEVVLRCKDNGRGIPLHMQQKIFEPFTRVEQFADSRGEASLGIGLTLVKRLVDLHLGKISVESGGAGMGSEFVVRLPLEPAPFDQPSTLETKPEHASRRLRSIVLIEDNSDVARTIVVALQRAGYQVTFFADAFSALAGLAELKPHAILLDIGLPGMDGYELAAKLRKKQNLRHTLFIAISGFKRRETADDFDHYFTKPVNLVALLNLLGSTPAQAGNGKALRKGEPSDTPMMRVLLIDDHAALSAVTAELLNREGFEVRTALSGEKGLKLANDFQPELILCDLNLPDTSGKDVIRKLRSNPATRHAYSVILTALSESDILELNGEAKQMGVDEFIRKPLTRESVHSLMANLKRECDSQSRRATTPS
jgi:PAS domain S-box-containing protein